MSTAVTVKGDDSFKPEDWALFSMDEEERAEAIDELNQPGEALTLADLKVLRVPGPGSIRFTVEGVPMAPGDEGPKSVMGIALEMKTPRRFYDKKYDGKSDDPPDCFSPDGMQGYGTIATQFGGDCSSCPMDEWGSVVRVDPDSKSAGKACKEYLEVFILEPDEILPTVLVVPVTSRKIVRNYFRRLVGKGGRIGVVTEFSLVDTKTKSGQQVSVITPRKLASITRETKALARGYGKVLAGVISNGLPQLPSPGTPPVEISAPEPPNDPNDPGPVPDGYDPDPNFGDESAANRGYADSGEHPARGEASEADIF